MRGCSLSLCLSASLSLCLSVSLSRCLAVSLSRCLRAVSVAWVLYLATLSPRRYTGTEFTTRQGNPQLGVGPAVAHPELYANFGRQTRWLDCCTFCELHSRCWHWTVRQPKRDRGKLTSGRCTMYTENVSSTATSPDDESSYVSGTVARPAGRSKYLGGLSAHRAGV